MTTFKQHPEFHHILVSSCGTMVYSTKSYKYLKIFVNSNGYYSTVVTVSKGVFKHYRIHRLVAETFIPTDDKTLDVHHKDHDKSNNHVSNLEWCTRGQNIKYAMLAGVNPQMGVTHSSSVLTEEQVHKICELLQEGWRTIDIADFMGVDKSIICGIRTKRNYKEISNQYTFKVVRKERISKEKVHMICEMLEEGISPKEITAKLKINRHLAVRIKDKQTYTDISKNYNF